MSHEEFLAAVENEKTALAKEFPVGTEVSVFKSKMKERGFQEKILEGPYDREALKILNSQVVFIKKVALYPYIQDGIFLVAVFGRDGKITKTDVDYPRAIP